MAHRIEVGLIPGFRDAHGEKTAKRIREDLAVDVAGVDTIHVYTIDADFSSDELETIAENLLVDPVIQQSAIDSPLARARAFDFAMEVGYLPGVTDNVGRTAREGISLIFPGRLAPEQKVYTSTQYLIRGAIDRPAAERIATGLLGNPLIQRFDILDYKTFIARGGVAPYVPKVSGRHDATVTEVDLGVSDEALMRISREGVLALSLEEMKTIQAYIKKEAKAADRKKLGLGPLITDVELEVIAQTWSEHCKHKI